MPGFTGNGPSPKAEFHRQHRWIIEELGIPSSSGRPGQALRGEAKKRSQLALYARDLQLPVLEFDIESIKSPSLEYKIAKHAKWRNCTVSFYDVYGLYKEFYKWQQEIWTPQTGLKAANAYKGQPVFALRDGKGKVRQRFTLKGAFPQSIDHGELSYTNSEIKVLTVTYAYDWAEIEVLDSKPSPDNGMSPSSQNSPSPNRRGPRPVTGS